MQLRPPGLRALSAPLTFEVAPIESGRRLDVVLVARVEGMSRARARKLAAEGKIQVNGYPARKGRTVSAGDCVSLTEVPPSPGFSALPDTSMPLEVLYEDAHVVVINKPPGIPTHPLRPDEIGTAASALVAHYPEMAGVGYTVREPGILHRLDIGTSGALLAARDDASFEALRDTLRRGHIDKRYLALCAGVVDAPAVIEAPIDRHPSDRRRVRAHPKGDAPLSARHARTEVVSAKHRGRLSLVVARARTGARHQLRAHLSFIGHPLAGDALYGGPVVPGLSHHFLHAESLSFAHPVGGSQIVVEAPLPKVRLSVLETLGLAPR
jgi:23S rRNA pseudouridine1911/1915/1917 synthase